jgi:signal transduction histidine kinase
MTSPDTSPSWTPDAERLRALAEFAAGAGHEINNPLAAIIGRAQLLLRDESDPQRRQSLATIVAQAYRIRDMIGDVMLVAQPPQPQRQAVALRAAVQSVVERLAQPLADGRCRVDISTGQEFEVSADPVQLAVVASELLRNAITALQPSGGIIQIELTRPDELVEWRVTDQGCGFSELERQHAFDPFFSGRQAGRGLGFGLCKVAQIVHQHGGTIAVRSGPGGPTTVTVRWPPA